MVTKIYEAILRRIWRVCNIHQFRTLGANSYVNKPLRVNGKKNISIGDNVFVAYNIWLAAVPDTNSDLCELIIGNGTNIGHFNHIYATKSITIGQNVLIADRVYISDNLHSYENVSLPIIKQPIKQIATVKIDDGAWVGENVCIIGASVGKNSVIGANSVVTKSIPDYCVAVGSPAKVIKRYCFKKNVWLKTDDDGNFIN